MGMLIYDCALVFVCLFAGNVAWQVFTDWQFAVAVERSYFQGCALIVFAAYQWAVDRGL